MAAIPFWKACLAGMAVALGAQAAPQGLEVYAELQAGGVGGITQLPDGRVVIGYHPFYAPKVQVALLNADRKSTTPYPDAQWQSCRKDDGSWKGDFNRCLDWVLGLHTDANGILWLLDSAKTTDQAAGRPAGLMPKLVGWNTRTNSLERVIPIPPPASIPESQHNDFVVDLKHKAIVIADEAIGEGSAGDGSKAALVVVDLASGTSRRLLQGHPSVMPVKQPIRWDVGRPTEGSFKLYVGVDGIALDKDSEWLYFGALNGHKIWRVRMRDLLDRALTPQQLGERVQAYADKPFNGGLSIDTAGNLYLTEVGERAIGVIPPDTRRYRRLVQHEDMVWPDGVTYNRDGYMYTGAAQLPLSSALQADGVARNKAPYRVYRFKPLAPGLPGF
jgi:sugar lactone lactonase YvrE